MPFLPLHDRNPRVLVQRPWITWGLIVACVTIYLLQLQAPPGELQRLVLALGVIPASIMGDAQLSEDLYLVPAWATLVTHQFLHGSLPHVIFNMAYLWVFGDNIEDAMGHRRFLVFFLICGVAGALAEVFADPGLTAPIIGASGAISGILAAYLLLHPQAKVLVPIIIFPVYLPAYVLLVIWIAFQVYAATALPPDLLAEGGVAWWAHIGGFMAGLVLIVPFKHKALPLWQGAKLPSGLELTVQDYRPERREEPPQSSSQAQAGNEDKKPRRGPWS